MTSSADADRIAELEQDNQRLRRLLDQRDAPGELRHRLRNTLALLRAIIRRSAATTQAIADYVGHLEDRLDAIARAQALADQHGGVDLRSLVANELLQYGASEDGSLTLSGPDVRMYPKAGQVIALAIHELAVNAVQHGALGAPDGRVEISWRVIPFEPGVPIELVWTETNGRVAAPTAPSGFGTEVLTQMLRYDFHAETQMLYGPGGLRYTVRFPNAHQLGFISDP